MRTTKVISFNCRGCRGNKEYIRTLAKQGDIIFLAETQVDKWVKELLDHIKGKDC